MILLRLSVIITDLVFFLSALFLFNTFYPDRKPSRFGPGGTLLTFCIIFMDVGLMAIDNGSTQYNSIIFSLVILSVVCLYKQRILLSALLYSLSILTKHITFFYSFGYVSFLLLTYCLTLNPKAIRLNFLNSTKLAAVVLSSIVVVMFPYRHKLKEMSYLIMGGVNEPQIAVPNLKFLLSLI